MRLISISRGSRSGPQFRSARSAFWDHRYLYSDITCNLERQTYPWLVRLFRKLVFKRRSARFPNTSSLMYAILRQTALRYYRSADLRFLLGRHQRHQEGIAFTAVHELSHALWERLEGQPLDKKWSGTSADWEKFSLLVEGYAEYAHQIWFWDLYPACVREIAALYTTRPGECSLPRNAENPGTGQPVRPADSPRYPETLEEPLNCPRTSTAACL